MDLSNDEIYYLCVAVLTLFVGGLVASAFFGKKEDVEMPDEDFIKQFLNRQGRNTYNIMTELPDPPQKEND